jgi:predicted branched-subunit amino acid permease
MSGVAVAGRADGPPALTGLRPDREALADVVPVLAGLVPFAAVIGVQMSAGGDVAGGLSGTLLLYAGSAQVSLLTLLEHGAGVASILATVALVNARFVVYSAGLAARFEGQPTWFRWLGPHFIVDQTFALASARADMEQPARFRRYWLTLGMSIAVVWVAAMSAGALLGPAVPSSSAAAFMPVAMFLALLMAQLRESADVVAAAGAGMVALVATSAPSVTVLLGTVVGAGAGLVTRKVRP